MSALIELKCEGCGKTAQFEDADKAFMAGWDCPPRFITHVTCESCGIEKTAWFRGVSRR